MQFSNSGSAMLCQRRLCAPSRGAASSKAVGVVHHGPQPSHRRTCAHAAPSDDKQPSSSGSGATAETSAGLKAVWYAAEVSGPTPGEEGVAQQERCASPGCCSWRCSG